MIEIWSTDHNEDTECIGGSLHIFTNMPYTVTKIKLHMKRRQYRQNTGYLKR